MTIEINYLPWRKDVRKAKKNKFVAILATTTLIALSTSYFFYLKTDSELKYRKDRIDFIQKNSLIFENQIVEIEQMKADKKKILERAGVIKELEKDRNLIIKSLDYLTKTIPDSIHFKSLNIIDERFEIIGIAKDRNDISKFMRAIDKSDLLLNSKINYVESLENISEEFEFLLTASKPLVIENTEEEGNDG